MRVSGDRVRLLQCGYRSLVLRQELLANPFGGLRNALGPIRSALGDGVLQACQERLARLAVVQMAVHLVAHGIVDDAVHVIGERSKQPTATWLPRHLSADM